MIGRRATRVAVVVLSVAALGLTPPASNASGRQDEGIESPPIGIVVLVDESGSLGAEGVQAERDAAATIAQSEFSPRSQVAVIGFGGRNGGENQSPVKVTCQPTMVAEGPDRDYLARCVQDLHRRTEAEGDSTDFPSALLQGLEELGEMEDVSSKVMFLLTDGQLDVRKDPGYGPEDERQDAARARQAEYLERADELGVSVWPLGFGDAKQKELDAFAAGGSQRTCNPGSPKPRARIATDPSAVANSLAEVYAAARCGGVSTAPPTPLGAGDTVELKVDVPLIATDGSIAVNKADPAINVSYLDPDEQEMPKSGERDGSVFQVSGEGSSIEVLRIRDPKPGEWTVRLTAPPDLADQTVSAVVIWQGAVRSVVTLNPPSPRPGEDASVELTLRTRRGPLADPEALRDVSASATLSGSGFQDVEVPLTAGSGGQFTGKVDVPDSATGDYRLIGVVSGRGITTDERPSPGSFDLGTSALRAQIQYDPVRVEPGGEITGTISVSSDLAEPRRLALTLSEVDSRTLVTITPTTAEAKAGGTTPIPFTLRFDPDTELGSGGARLRVTDAANDEVLYADRVLAFEVGYPPPWWQRYLWLLIVLAVTALLAAVAVVMRIRRRRDDIDVRGLRAELYRHGRQVTYLQAPDSGGARFAFVVDDDHTDTPGLSHAMRDDTETYVARRAGSNAVLLHQPDGLGVELRAGERAELPGGLALAFVDSGGPAPGRTRRRVSARRADAAPADLDDGLYSSVPADRSHEDDLL